MFGEILFAILSILSVPVLLIVILVKVSGLKSQLSSLGKKVEEMASRLDRGNDAKDEADALSDKEAAVAPPVETAPVAPPANPEPETAPVTPPEPPPVPKPPREPTAIDIFWKRIEDWFAVRGDFAPKGVTHEFAFATRWLVRVGVVLIVGAIVYFVKLSIDRGWMGPTGRVVATLACGAAFSVGGSWLVKKERYSLLGHAIAALGVVALYLGFGLGHRFFDPPVIASPVIAFCALAAVTFCAGVMSVYLRSPYIAVM